MKPHYLKTDDFEISIKTKEVALTFEDLNKVANFISELIKDRQKASEEYVYKYAYDLTNRVYKKLRFKLCEGRQRYINDYAGVAYTKSTLDNLDTCMVIETPKIMMIVASDKESLEAKVDSIIGFHRMPDTVVTKN